MRLVLLQWNTRRNATICARRSDGYGGKRAVLRMLACILLGVCDLVHRNLALDDELCEYSQRM